MALYMVNLAFIALLLCAANVATLVSGRTVRSGSRAHGARRQPGRVVSQLAAERRCSAVGAVAGLGLRDTRSAG